MRKWLIRKKLHFYRTSKERYLDVIKLKEVYLKQGLNWEKVMFILEADDA
jgi:hypothetical protein